MQENKKFREGGLFRGLVGNRLCKIQRNLHPWGGRAGALPHYQVDPSAWPSLFNMDQQESQHQVQH